jgi:hypothetical protein
MSEGQTEGGAIQAIAAHSKHVLGSPPASSATGNEAGPSAEIREAVGRVGASVTGAAVTARQSLTEGLGRGARQASAFMRQRPLRAGAHRCGWLRLVCCVAGAKDFAASRGHSGVHATFFLALFPARRQRSDDEYRPA